MKALHWPIQEDENWVLVSAGKFRVLVRLSVKELCWIVGKN